MAGGTVTATTPTEILSSGPKITGAKHEAIDTQDGFVIIRRVASMSTVPKGVKGAPEDIKEPWLDGAVQFGQRNYDQNKIAHPLHVGHHDDLGLTHPEFAGFFKPVERGVLNIDGKDKPVIFCDYKVKKSIFENKMLKGEMPYVSPEIRSWDKKAISSIALLDSAPPHFPFPMLTQFDVKVDPTAVFSADLPKGCSIAKFEDGVERINFDYDDTKPDHKEPEEAKCCGHCEANRQIIQKMSQDLYGGKMEAGKPNSAPIEQPAAVPTQQGAQANIRMEEDPKVAARFAALEDKNAALAKRLDERDQKEKAEALAAKALGELREYQIGETTKAQVAKFAMQGEAALKDFVAAVKEVAIKEAPRSLYEAELAGAIKLNDPVIAKFGGNDPGKQEKVAKFAADFRTFKKTVGKGSRITEEDWIAQAMKEAELGGNV